MDWNLVFSILTALGLFEIIKRIFYFSVENNLIKRNLEIREIANRVLEWSSWLKLRNFERPLPPEVANQIYIDIFKIQDIDHELGSDMMRLINYPQMNSFLHENCDKQPGNLDMIRDNCQRLHDMTDKLNKKCNKLRYQPIFDFAQMLSYVKRIKSKHG